MEKKLRIEWRPCVINFAVAILVIGFYSCGQQVEKPSIEQVREKDLNTSQVPRKAEYSPGYTKFYVVSNPEDLMTSSYTELENRYDFEVLKNVGSGEGGRTYTLLKGDGVQIEVDSDSGVIRNVVLKSSKHSVEKGGRVGMSRSEISDLYTDGTYQITDGKVDKRCYLYLEQLPESSVGIGFRFYFNGDTVDAIAAGPWSLAP